MYQAIRVGANIRWIEINGCAYYVYAATIELKYHDKFELKYCTFITLHRLLCALQKNNCEWVFFGLWNTILLSCCYYNI